jgi:hypothetical protein
MTVGTLATEENRTLVARQFFYAIAIREITRFPGTNSTL